MDPPLSQSSPCTQDSQPCLHCATAICVDGMCFAQTSAFCLKDLVLTGQVSLQSAAKRYKVTGQER
jgi:hypothetical protein